MADLDRLFERTLAASAPTTGGAPGGLAAYAGALCGSLLTTRATPRALLLAATRFDVRGAPEAAALCRRKAAEETGHDALVLADLDALGISPDLAEQTASTWARMLAWTHGDLAAKPRPFGVLGYAYVLERFAAMVTAEMIAQVQAMVPDGLDITRMRRVHSATGDDADHVADLAAFIGGLSSADRSAVATTLGLVIPMLIGAAFDPMPAVRLADAGWQPPRAIEKAA